MPAPESVKTTDVESTDRIVRVPVSVPPPPVQAPDPSPGPASVNDGIGSGTLERLARLERSTVSGTSGNGSAMKAFQYAVLLEQIEAVVPDGVAQEIPSLPKRRLELLPPA
jgi:hypothetical protein